MVSERIAEIDINVEEPGKIRALYLASKLEEEELGSETDSVEETVSHYLEKYKEKGLVEDDETGYRLTERGNEMMPNSINVSRIPDIVFDDPLDKYWPALAYASCNNSWGGNGSINHADIAEQSDLIENTYENSQLLKQGERKGYVSQKMRGDWEITDKGAELVNEGFETSEIEDEEGESDYKGLIMSIASRKLEEKEFVDRMLEMEEERGLIETIEDGKYRISEKGAEEMEKENEWSEEDVMYQTGEWEDIIARLRDKSKPETNLIVIGYAQQRMSSTNKNEDFDDSEFIENIDMLRNKRELYYIYERAFSEGIVDHNRGKITLDDKAEEIVNEGYDFNEKEILYNEMSEKEKEELFDNIVERHREQKNLEVVTVNEDLIVLEGGRALNIDKHESPEEGEKIEVVTTGKTTGFGGFEKVEKPEK